MFGFIPIDRNKPGHRSRPVGICLMSGLVKLTGTNHSFPGELDEFSLGFDPKKPSVEAIGPPTRHTRRSTLCKFHLQFYDHILDDVILQSKDILSLPVETICPEVSTDECIN